MTQHKEPVTEGAAITVQDHVAILNAYLSQLSPMTLSRILEAQEACEKALLSDDKEGVKQAQVRFYDAMAKTVKNIPQSGLIEVNKLIKEKLITLSKINKD